MEVLSVLWTLLTFALGLIWSVIWFVLRDPISTLLWLLFFLWLVLSVRYRSMRAGVLALFRYGRYGFRLFWRWLRGSPAGLPGPDFVPVPQSAIVRERRIPFGYMSVSEQLNVAVVSLVALLLLA